MKRHIDDEIQSLKDRVLRMGSLAEEMIHLAVKTLIERKAEYSQKVFEREQQVNLLQMEIDEEGVRILALYQPEARDLRTIMSAIKINAELERIADQAVNITQTCCNYLLTETPLSSTLDIPRMAELAKEMIKDSLDAFTRRDVELAQSILKKDVEQDILKARLLNEVVATIPQQTDKTQQLIELILIAKNLEKIGDHATNIAEDIIFMILGQDVRHHNHDHPELSPQAQSEPQPESSQSEPQSETSPDSSQTN